MQEKWFSGKRLSTEEQRDLLERLRSDPEVRGMSTGDTLVRVSLGAFVVYRQDFAVELTDKEIAERSWIDE